MTKETKDLGAATPRSLTEDELHDMERSAAFVRAAYGPPDQEVYLQAGELLSLISELRSARKALADERRGALEEAAEVCKALSASPRGNDYGSVGNAYEECADAIGELAEGTAPQAPPDSSAALLEARRLLELTQGLYVHCDHLGMNGQGVWPHSPACRWCTLKPQIDAFLRSDSERSEPARSESGGSNSVDAPTKEER